MNAIAPFATFQQFVAAVVVASLSGEVDGRLKHSAAASGQNETVGNLGGFLVPSEFAAEIWTRVYATGRLLARCDRQPVTKGDRLSIPAISEEGRGDGEQPIGSRFGGAQMYWTDEAGPGNDSKVELDLIKLHLHKLLGLVYTSDELVEDAPALAAALKRMFGLEAAFEIENSIVNGDGVAKPLGILKSTSLITVQAEAGQAAGTVIYQNLANMVQRMWGPSQNSAVWLMGNDALGQVLSMVSGTGEPLIKVDVNGVRRLMSFPLEICEYTPALGLGGDILLADLSQYLLAEKDDQPDLISSIHVRYANDESVFKLRYRVDGAPAWKTPITPKNSNNTQSPFVTLGPRA